MKLVSTLISSFVQNEENRETFKNIENTKLDLESFWNNLYQHPLETRGPTLLVFLSIHVNRLTLLPSEKFTYFDYLNFTKILVSYFILFTCLRILLL